MALYNEFMPLLIRAALLLSVDLRHQDMKNYFTGPTFNQGLSVRQVYF